jgi:hypothetical protein
MAQDICDVCGEPAACPGEGSCCAPNGTPGCDDEACCAAVCACDPFCCDTEWDVFCVGPNEIVPGCSSSDLCGCEPLQQILYSNIGGTVNGGFTHGSAIAADDIFAVATGPVGEITFSLVNFAPSALISVDIDLVFWELLVSTGGLIQAPVIGQELAIINVAGDLPEPLGGGGFGVFLAVVPDEGAFFDVPASRLMWAGLRINSATFEAGGTIDDVGQLLVNPPAVGSSVGADLFWLEGFGLAFFGGNPIANFGWQLVAADLGPAVGACCTGDATPCPGDINSSGSVDVFDLLDLLSAWGPCPGCAADLTGDNVVDVFDLLGLLSAWGPCPEGGGAACSILTEDECIAIDGTYSGDGTGCDWPGVCVDPVGACCLGNGNCQLQTAGACAAGGGYFHGAFVSCDDANCPLALTCPPGASPEGETCGDNTNGGCNSTPPVFQPITCGQTYCGTVWAEDGTRDTDWYTFTLTEESEVTVTGETQFPGLIFVVNDICGTGAQVQALGVAPPNTPFETSACLPPGTYRIVVVTGTVSGGIFDGIPCGSLQNEYILSLSCGACPGK